MFGYCARCKEVRSDEDKNSWGFQWIDDLPICNRCGAVVDIWEEEHDED